ncbi:MAG: BMP family ABC transporter substrate-binding protein [Chloroflexi bacterium]|nr:BMP family ABC transporter substrate-binding protein [Chloroflexota bacterium]
MRKTVYILLVLALLATAVAACGAPKATPTPEKKALKVVLLINGVLGDKSFFDSAQRGIDRAVKELGIQAKTIEAGTDPARWEAALEDAAATEDYDILICGTWQMNDYLGKVAPKYPDKKFFIFDTSVDYSKGNLGNVYSVLYKQNEGSYLAGVYAAMMTQKPLPGMNDKKVIGVIGGMDIPVINDFIVGYKQGARDVDPETQVIVQYSGGWNDPAKGKEITLAMYEQGADIVFNVAGGTGMGIFEAAEEQNRYAIGVDSDQAIIVKDTDPQQAERILTSMLKNVDNSLFRALKLHLEGKLVYGQAEYLGIAEGGVGLAKNEYYEKYTPTDVKARVEQAEKDILEGKIKVDTAF